jgi:LmbE family N-acetylglucosaminyl deacetylase
MDREKARQYYGSMMSQLYGLQDDMDANRAPDEAKTMLAEIIEICRSDMVFQFGEEKPD